MLIGHETQVYIYIYIEAAFLVHSEMHIDLGVGSFIQKSSTISLDFSIIGSRRLSTDDCRVICKKPESVLYCVEPVLET